MLRQSRVIAAAGLCAAILIAGGAAAPAASASRSAAAGIPASARTRITSEMLKAWQITKGSGVIVAVLSTHVDSVTGLSGKLITGPDYAPEAGAPAVEGTVLASLIAGSGPTSSDAFGTVGRAPAARILALQVADYGGGHGAARYQRNGTWDVLAARAIRYAVHHGAKVIVNDEAAYVSGDDNFTKLASAVAYAISKNVVVLGGGYVWGHRHGDEQVPDDLPGVINYSGTVLSGLTRPPRVSRSPVDYSVLVTAPSNVLTATGPANEPYTAFGSLATKAWVAGTVTMIKSVYPRISPGLVARALAESASYHPAGGYSKKVGFGLINPDGALHAAARLLKLRATAAPGGTVQSTGARFTAAAPPVIQAVHHSPAKLGIYAGAIALGVVLVLLALLLARRRRPAPAPPLGMPGPPGPPAAT